MTKPRIAYLVSLYPAVTHTFIIREILGLKKLGFDIAAASINPLDKNHLHLTQDEENEYKKTFYIKPQGFFTAFLISLKTLFLNPAGYFKGLYTVFRLGGLNPIRLLYHFAYFGEALILGDWMKSEDINHLHVHFINPATTVALIASKIFPITYSFTSHGPDEFYDVKGQDVLEKILGAKFCVSISFFNQSQLMRIAPQSEWKKFHVIYLGIDPSLFMPQPGNQNKHDFEILYVARLTSTKGQLLLIKAVEGLIKEGLNIRLRLIGNGPDLEMLKRYENEKIVLEGPVNQDRIRGFYRKADLFVMPSFAEGLPIVLMEAMAMEIPCVSTDINGIPELIEDKVNGLLIPPSSIEAIQKAIKECYQDEKMRERIAKKGREKILQQFDLNQNLKQLADLFERELADGNPR